MNVLCTWNDVVNAFADYSIHVSENETETENAMIVFANTFGDDSLRKKTTNYINIRRSYKEN